jgi:hypothetical protein
MSGPVLSHSALAQLRRLQNANMPSECDLVGYDTTRASGGRETRTRVLIATVPCRLVNLSATLVVRGEQPTPAATYMLVLPEGTDIAMARLATVRGNTDGVAWSADLELGAPLEPRSYSASVRVYANLVPVVSSADTPVVATVTVSDTP